MFVSVDSQSADIALSVAELVKVYHPRGRPPVRALDGMSLAVRRGQIFGLLGPNGAGKTTLLKILTTLTRPTSGQARVLGFDVVGQPLEVRRRLSVVLQESAVEMFLTVRDNLLTFARFHGLRGGEARRRLEDVLARFQLGEVVDRKVMDLSGGFRRRVQVAKMFMVDTPVLFLDEFTTGMDPLLKRDLMGYLRQEAARGRTIVLTTQVLGEAEDLCDDILIMNKGRQVARGDLHSLKLLSRGIYDVALTFESLPPELAEELARLNPLRLSVAHNTVEMTLKAEEAEVLALVTGLAGRGRLLKMEVSGPTLEDVFIELMKEKTAPAD